MRETFSVKSRSLEETNILNKLNGLLIKAQPSRETFNQFRQMSSIGNYRGGFGMINDSSVCLTGDDNMTFEDNSQPVLKKTDGIQLSIEEKFRFVHHLIKLITLKMQKEKKHFTSMRRYALQNNQKDDYFNIIR